MEIKVLDTIGKYCEAFGFTNRHALVEVVDCEEPERLKPYTINWGFYALYLKDMASCTITYGKTKYDHGDKSIIAFAPGQVCAFEAIPGKDPKFKGVLFHPDFIHGTPLGKAIKRYNFFNYETNEALHLTPQEFRIIQNLIEIVDFELDHEMDEHSKDIVSTNILLLLDYCDRFYDRQFKERTKLNHDVLLRFENLIDEYLASGKGKHEGVPSVKYFSDKICLSPNYFSDLVKRETGVSPKEYISQRILATAKEMLLAQSLSIAQISEQLGFLYPQHFTRFFKKQTGKTPLEYRKS